MLITARFSLEKSDIVWPRFSPTSCNEKPRKTQFNRLIFSFQGFPPARSENLISLTEEIWFQTLISFFLSRHSTSTQWGTSAALPSDVRPSSTCPKAGSGNRWGKPTCDNDENNYDDNQPSSTCPKAGSGRLTIITITTNDDNDYDDQRVAQVADENQCVITTIAIMMTKGGMLSFRWDGTSLPKNLYDDDHNFDHNHDNDIWWQFRWDGTSLRKNEEFNLREDLAWSFFHTVKVVHIYQFKKEVKVSDEYL